MTHINASAPTTTVETPDDDAAREFQDRWGFDPRDGFRAPTSSTRVTSGRPTLSHVYAVTGVRRRLDGRDEAAAFMRDVLAFHGLEASGLSRGQQVPVPTPEALTQLRRHRDAGHHLEQRDPTLNGSSDVDRLESAAVPSRHVAPAGPQLPDPSASPTTGASLRPNRETRSVATPVDAEYPSPQPHSPDPETLALFERHGLRYPDDFAVHDIEGGETVSGLLRRPDYAGSWPASAEVIRAATALHRGVAPGGVDLDTVRRSDPSRGRAADQVVFVLSPALREARREALIPAAAQGSSVEAEPRSATAQSLERELPEQSEALGDNELETPSGEHAPTATEVVRRDVPSVSIDGESWSLDQDFERVTIGRGGNLSSTTRSRDADGNLLYRPWDAATEAAVIAATQHHRGGEVDVHRYPRGTTFWVPISEERRSARRTADEALVSAPSVGDEAASMQLDAEDISPPSEDSAARAAELMALGGFGSARLSTPTDAEGLRNHTALQAEALAQALAPQGEMETVAAQELHQRFVSAMALQLDPFASDQARSEANALFSETLSSSHRIVGMSSMLHEEGQGSAYEAYGHAVQEVLEERRAFQRRQVSDHLGLFLEHAPDVAESVREDLDPTLLAHHIIDNEDANAVEWLYPTRQEFAELDAALQGSLLDLARRDSTGSGEERFDAYLSAVELQPSRFVEWSSASENDPVARRLAERVLTEAPYEVLEHLSDSELVAVLERHDPSLFQVESEAIRRRFSRLEIDPKMQPGLAVAVAGLAGESDPQAVVRDRILERISSRQDVARTRAALADNPSLAFAVAIALSGEATELSESDSRELSLRWLAELSSREDVDRDAIGQRVGTLISEGISLGATPLARSRIQQALLHFRNHPDVLQAAADTVRSQRPEFFADHQHGFRTMLASLGNPAVEESLLDPERNTLRHAHYDPSYRRLLLEFERHLYPAAEWS